MDTTFMWLYKHEGLDARQLAESPWQGSELAATFKLQDAQGSQPDQIRHLLQLIQPPKRELLEHFQLAESPRQRLKLVAGSS